MKPNEIKAQRVRLSYTQQFVADALGINVHSYRKKENGEVRFSDNERAELAKVLQLTLAQMNDWLFDGVLPIEC